MSSIKLQYRQYSIDPELPVFYFDMYNRPVNHAAALNDGEEIRYMHLHNCIEIACVNTDGGEFSANGEVHTLKKDDLVIVMPYCTHILRERHEGLYSEYLYFDPFMLLRRVCPEAIPICHIFESKNSPACAVLRGDKAALLTKRVREVIDELRNQRLHGEMCIKGLLLALIIEMARILGDEKPLERRVSSVTPIIPALRYINAHFSENISMEHLQEICHLSGTHFRRLFGSIMGCSPLEFIQNLRVSRACDLLLSSDLSILSISLTVGFDSVSSFNRQFAKIVGMPPSKWRKARQYSHVEYLPESLYDGRFCAKTGE